MKPLKKMKGMTWASPIFILSLAIITFAVLLFITTALFMTHTNLITLYHITEKNETRFLNYETRLNGVSEEMQILADTDFQHSQLISSLQDRQKEIIETSAFWQAMVRRHNQDLIQAGILRHKANLQ